MTHSKSPIEAYSVHHHSSKSFLLILSLFVVFLITGILLIVIQLNSPSSKASKAKNIEPVSVESFKEKSDTTSSAMILDVRSKEAFSADHLVNALNVQPNQVDYIIRNTKTSRILVYGDDATKNLVKETADKIGQTHPEIEVFYLKDASFERLYQAGYSTESRVTEKKSYITDKSGRKIYKNDPTPQRRNQSNDTGEDQ